MCSHLSSGRQIRLLEVHIEKEKWDWIGAKRKSGLLGGWMQRLAAILMVAGLVSLLCARIAKHRQLRVDAANENIGYFEEDTDIYNEGECSPRTAAGALNRRTHELEWDETGRE